MVLDHIRRYFRFYCRLRYLRLLSPYIDGELRPASRKMLEQHLHKCKSCQAEYEDLLFASQLVSKLQLIAEVPPDINTLAKRRSPLQLLPRAKRLKMIAASVAAVLLVSIGIALWRYTKVANTSWEVISVTGAPTVDSARMGETGKLRVGQWLETDGSSRAVINIGKIGQVEVEPNTRIRLVSARSDEQRLELSSGWVQATIQAPPRVFFVETPSATAVDLGCSYKLEVDDSGSGLLQVRAGWVALVLNNRESLVPAGAICQSRPGIGPGTPYFVDASGAFKNALNLLDFENGGSDALNIVLTEARVSDVLTLWHLIFRVEDLQRGRVYDRLSELAPPPAIATRDSVMRLERGALDEWRKELEYISVGVDPNLAPKATGSIQSTGKMNEPRFSHSATLLADGSVLIAGGMNGDDATRSAEIYDPNTGAFIPTGSMRSGRFGHTATLLSDGRVLITGGIDKHHMLASAEIYDPAKGLFISTGDMKLERTSHRATLLQNGKVLITGGNGEEWPEQANAELYDPATGRFTFAGKMSTPRADHTATLLENGKVLIAGGSSANRQSQSIVASAEIYDPERKIFIPTVGMAIKRHKHSAERLPDGKVIIIGGSDESIWKGQYSSAEIYDPSTGAFTLTGNMRTARYKIRDAAVLLKNGRVLVAGASPRAEIYDPATGIFGSVAGDMGEPRFYSTATLLQSGEVLITGGYTQHLQPNDGAWIYKPEF
jgi:hypothetical protein